MPWNAPTSPLCPSCSRPVFPAEAFMAADRRPFHKHCVKCSNCSKKLVPATINQNKDKLFCNLCYANLCMPKEDIIPERVAMQVLPVGGLYSALEEEKRRAREEAMRREMEERAKKEGGCPTCCTMTGPDDAVDISGIRFHKQCLRCTACSKPAGEEGTPMMLGPKDSDSAFGPEQLDPYCNFCFAKKYKMSAINIAETVCIINDESAFSL